MNQPGIKLYTPFPVSEPTDTETITRIKKLAGYVIRNGVQFEEMVRMREKENPLFSFLFGGDYSNYYKWTIFCLRQRYSAEQIAFVVENYHKQLSSIPPGQLDLTVEDQTVFYDLLSSNSGSKEKIRQIRKWIMDRAHSMVTISVVLYEFIRTSCTDFQQILHCVYVINDVLFHSGTAMLKGEYTSLLPEELNVKIPVFSCFSFRLAHILRHAYKFAGNEVEKEKLVKLVQLWESRGFIDSQYSSDLVKRMTDVIDPPEAPLPLISYPCPITLPPPTPPVLPPPVVGTQGPPPPPFLFQQQPPPPPPPAGFMDPFSQHNMPPSNFNSILPMMMPPRLPPHPPGLPLPNTFMLGNMPLQVAPPLPLPPPPASALPVLDIQKTSVGYMANLVRAQLKMGHKPYVPIDVTCMSQVVQPFVEPGRLEARINEFYRRLKQKLDVLEPSESQLPVKSDYSHSSESDRGYWENNHPNGGRLNEEFSPRNQRGSRDSSSITPTATTAAPHVPISEDNMGHKLLRNLGWQQGYGLGAESSGRVDPITESAKKDRSGVGSGVDTIAFAGQEFSQYRNQQSAEYFTRIVERER